MSYVCDGSDFALLFWEVATDSLMHTVDHTIIYAAHTANKRRCIAVLATVATNWRSCPTCCMTPHRIKQVTTDRPQWMKAQQETANRNQHEMRMIYMLRSSSSSCSSSSSSSSRSSSRRRSSSSSGSSGSSSSSGSLNPTALLT